MKALTASSALCAGAGVVWSELSCATHMVPERRKAKDEPDGDHAGCVKPPSASFLGPSPPSARTTCSEEVPPSSSWPVLGDQETPATPAALATVLVVAPSVTATLDSVVYA